MKAAQYSRNGTAQETLELVEMPKPSPNRGEVLVRVRASGVNPSDVKSRLARPLTTPWIIPHSDGAGVIDAVGEGVDPSRIGERVWLWNAQWGRAHGSACEYLAIDQSQAVLLPEGTSFEAGACLGIPALTALQAVNLCGDLRGKTVLVTGAASSVGHYAAQLCVQAGAIVIGTVGSAEKAAHAARVGVSECILYKEQSVVERLKAITHGAGVDAVIDMDFATTSRGLAEGLLRAHGVFVCYGSNPPAEIGLVFRPLLFQSVTLKFFLVYDLTPADRIKTLNQLTQLLESSKLIHTLAKTYPLADIVQAHLAVEQGTYMGNVVLSVA